MQEKPQTDWVAVAEHWTSRIFLVVGSAMSLGIMAHACHLGYYGISAAAFGAWVAGQWIVRRDSRRADRDTADNQGI